MKFSGLGYFFETNPNFSSISMSDLTHSRARPKLVGFRISEIGTIMNQHLMKISGLGYFFEPSPNSASNLLSDSIRETQTSRNSDLTNSMTSFDKVHDIISEIDISAPLGPPLESTIASWDDMGTIIGNII